MNDHFNSEIKKLKDFVNQNKHTCTIFGVSIHVETKSWHVYGIDPRSPENPSINIDLLEGSIADRRAIIEFVIFDNL